MWAPLLRYVFIRLPTAPIWTTPPSVMQRSIAGADGCPVSSGVVARMGSKNRTINLSFALARAPRVWEMAGIYSFVTRKVWAVLVLYASSCEGIICVATHLRRVCVAIKQFRQGPKTDPIGPSSRPLLSDAQFRPGKKRTHMGPARSV